MYSYISVVVRECGWSCLWLIVRVRMCCALVYLLVRGCAVFLFACALALLLWLRGRSRLLCVLYLNLCVFVWLQT